MNFHIAKCRTSIVIDSMPAGMQYKVFSVIVHGWLVTFAPEHCGIFTGSNIMVLPSAVDEPFVIAVDRIDVDAAAEVLEYVREHLRFKDNKIPYIEWTEKEFKRFIQSDHDCSWDATSEPTTPQSDAAVPAQHDPAPERQERGRRRGSPY